jgi:hypothetical protein
VEKHSALLENVEAGGISKKKQVFTVNIQGRDLCYRACPPPPQRLQLSQVEKPESVPGRAEEVLVAGRYIELVEEICVT